MAFVNAALAVYPVGAVFISYYGTSPAELFGGTWIEIEGEFPETFYAWRRTA